MVVGRLIHDYRERRNSVSRGWGVSPGSRCGEGKLIFSPLFIRFCNPWVDMRDVP